MLSLRVVQIIIEGVKNIHKGREGMRGQKIFVMNRQKGG